MWKNFLCSAHITGEIIMWNDFSDRFGTLLGHTKGVTALAPAGEYLFSGSNDCTIKKWNLARECLFSVNYHAETISYLLWYNGELYSSSHDCTIKRIAL